MPANRPRTCREAGSLAAVRMAQVGQQQPVDTQRLRNELNARFEKTEKKEQYWNGMRRFFVGKLTHKELTDIVRATLGPGNIARHNQFIRGIYINAEHAALPLENLVGKAEKSKKAAAAAAAAAAKAAAAAGRGGLPGRQSYDSKGKVRDLLAKPPLKKAAPRPFVEPWKVTYPTLGTGPPKIKSRLSSSISDVLLDEQSFLALHNRMVQLAMPTAVDAISPDSVILMMHALGAYLKTVVEGCPDVPKPLRSLRNVSNQRLATEPPAQRISESGEQEVDEDYEPLETEVETAARLDAEHRQAMQAQVQPTLPTAAGPAIGSGSGLRSSSRRRCRLQSQMPPLLRWRSRWQRQRWRWWQQRRRRRRQRHCRWRRRRLPLPLRRL